MTTPGPLKSVLRDPVILICGTLVIVTAMVVYGWLAVSNHSQDAARFAMLVGNAIIALSSLIGITTKVVKELQPINDAVTNGNGEPHPPS